MDSEAKIQKRKWIKFTGPNPENQGLKTENEIKQFNNIFGAKIQIQFSSEKWVLSSLVSDFCFKESNETRD